MPRLFRSILIVMVVVGTLVIDRLGHASTMCTIRYDILGTHGHHVFLLSRAGGECTGLSIVDVCLVPDSVSVRRAWEDRHEFDKIVCPYDQWFTHDFMQGGALAEGQASRIEFPHLDITIEAPPDVPDTVAFAADGSYQLPPRLPRIRGTKARLLYASEPYIQHNYLLRSAHVDTVTNTLLLITHSERGIKENYSTPTLGDGIMVLALDRYARSNKPR